MNDAASTEETPEDQMKNLTQLTNDKITLLHDAALILNDMAVRMNIVPGQR